MGSGVLIYNGPHSLHTAGLDVHKVSFYLWLLAVVAHLVPHFLEAVSLAAADLLGRPGVRMGGAATWRALVLGALGFGVVALSGHAGSYLQMFPKHR